MKDELLSPPEPVYRLLSVLGADTGLRPTEAFRAQPGDFDHKNLILAVHVTKTGRGQRVIAILRCLSKWAMDQAGHDLLASTLQTRMSEFARKHPALDGLCMESFRRNFASMMEMAGVPLETIDAHQGRYQNSVIKKHSLRDRQRAVKRMRPYINFLDGQGKLELVAVCEA